MRLPAPTTIAPRLLLRPHLRLQVHLFALLAGCVAGCSAANPATDAMPVSPGLDVTLTAPDGVEAPDAADSGPTTAGSSLPRSAFDPAAAQRGARVFTQGTLARPLFPLLALRNLWLVWPTSAPSDDPGYWQAFRDRYGFAVNAMASDNLPLGIQAVGSDVTFNCLMCHAGQVAGRTLIGAANSRLDLQGLYDDLVKLNMLAPTFGYPSYPIPWSFENRTGAAGANDAFGIGLDLSTMYAAPPMPINTHLGFQRPPPWWALATKQRIYNDGSGEVGGDRTMMAMLLGFGYSLSDLEGMEATFDDLRQYFLSLDSPAFDLDTIDPAKAELGQATFNDRCASCHGVHTGPDAAFPNQIVAAADVGTDPVRATSFTANEANWVNSSWFGADHPLMATGGYLAPPLVGIWARAPYFHNGSVPDLAGVLDSTQRPALWQRTGDTLADYDTIRVGWRVTVPSAAGDANTIDGRKIYDTGGPGLGNGGHTYADDLGDDDRAALLEYLKTL